MCCYHHSRVFCHLPARQLFPRGALSPRRRRCSSVLQKESRAGRNVLLRGSFCGLRYNPIRFQRLFLPTFSGKTEKVGLRSNSCGVAAFNSSSGESGQTGGQSCPPLQAAVQHHRRRHGCGLTINSAPPAPTGKKTASLCFFNAILTRFGTHFVISYSG